MNLPKGYVLKPWQKDDPFVWRNEVDVPEGGFLPDAFSTKMMLETFGVGRTARLQTWARQEADPNGPHWIGVRFGTPLHVDPRYPRYTHQVVVFNDGWGLTGFARLVNAPLKVGTVFCCDTHSPHQLLADPRLGTGSYYLAASMDAKEQLPFEHVRPLLLDFIRSVAEGIQS